MKFFEDPGLAFHTQFQPCKNVKNQKIKIKSFVCVIYENSISSKAFQIIFVFLFILCVCVFQY